jgi:outer membrane protein OmpA-like peptidoglycan-associated protein
VYFDFDKAVLTSTGLLLVDAVATQMRSDPTLTVALVGKADLPGAPTYNMALSDRRASTVRDALVARGISGNRIGARSVGEREPPMLTAETTREQLNRVVEITIN